jgi:hypothetical protein
MLARRRRLNCLMSLWFTSLSLAVLMTVIPFSFVLRLLQQLPPPLALSYRRWPMALNAVVVAVVTVSVSVFIRVTYLGGGRSVPRVLAMFLVAGLVYAFGLVLMLRQFCGVYSDYIVTVGRMGLVLQKTSYRNIEDVEHAVEGGGETRFRVHTSRGNTVNLTLPTRYGATFYAQIRKKLNDE